MATKFPTGSRKQKTKATRTWKARPVDRRVIELTPEHVRWKKLPVAGAMDLFPHECIGGGNKSDKARYSIVVQFEGGKLVRTDVDGRKKIIRDRAGAGEFFSRLAAKAGDYILITRTAVYRYKVTLLRTIGAE